MNTVESPYPASRRSATEIRARWGLYAVVGVLTLAVLMYSVVEQLFDTNFYFVWQATALLAGDRPYRDFYEMGSPLMTLISAEMQWATGYRLIGEFLIHWTFIVAGVVISLHLAHRLSHSWWASLTMTLVAIAIIAATPTYHFPKLFFYPLAVWVLWRYMEAPSVWRGAVVGLVTDVAFLFRHDHGIYIGTGAVLAFVLARVINPASRDWRSSVREIVAFTVTAAVPLLPWAILVQRNEGLIGYIRARAAWGDTQAPAGLAYLVLVLRDFNPATIMGVGRLPSREASQRWLLQLTLLLPLIMLVSAIIDIVRHRRDEQPLSLETARTIITAAMAIIVTIRLSREDSYFVVGLTLSTVLGARLLAAAGQSAIRVWRIVTPILAVSTLVVTGVAVAGYVAAWDLLKPSEARELAPTFHQLLTTPPIDALQPASRARSAQPAEWLTNDGDARLLLALRYLHDCTRDGDHIFVTGSTPYQVGYYTQRPIAGGHLEWHQGWLSDPVHERQSLMLLQRQRVPFAFSTHDLVLDDLRPYPDIRQYVQENYVPLEGTGGLLLVDRRRHATGHFGAVGFPCFR
jgi:hypothetical protein